jgi:uncharacterized membrane protein YfcA
MLPAPLLAGVPPQNALATNKLASTAGTSTALLNFIRHKKVVWRIAALGIAFALIGSTIGSQAILIFPNRIVAQIVVYLLPVALLLTLLPRPEQVTTPKKISFYQVPLICLLIGSYDGFFGPGTGSFLILAFYLVTGMSLIQASATAKVFSLASNIGALIIFCYRGKVFFPLGLLLAIANIAGNYTGSILAIKKGVPMFFLIISLTILLIFLGWKYLIN